MHVTAREAEQGQQFGCIFVFIRIANGRNGLNFTSFIHAND